MNKELSAREWIETNEVANLDLPDSVHEMDIEGKVKELCIAFGESYASARLEAYKAELVEVVKSKMMLEPKLFVEIGRHQAFEFILSHLTKKESDESK